MARFAPNAAVVVCSSVLLVGCFPLWQTLEVESFSIAQDGTLTGKETGRRSKMPGWPPDDIAAAGRERSVGDRSIAW